MTIEVDSAEYKCWHELGHAVVCLFLGGDVEFIEFLDGDSRGHARARCVVTPEIERTVACAGFASEFFLLKNEFAARGAGDDRDVSQIVFHNATGDREDFWERRLGPGEAFSEADDRKFTKHAIGPDLQSARVGDPPARRGAAAREAMGRPSHSGGPAASEPPLSRVTSRPTSMRPRPDTP